MRDLVGTADGYKRAFTRQLASNWTSAGKWSASPVSLQAWSIVCAAWPAVTPLRRLLAASEVLPVRWFVWKLAREP